MITLEDALRDGRGTERPFNCHVHGDADAAASVNVLKGVWYCHSCGASGTTDGKTKAPSVADLEAMLEPEKGVRVYPEAYLELFDVADHPEAYWLSRYPDWLVWAEQMGQDPFTGQASYPVRTPQGHLAGIVRRDPDGQPKYRYPYRWSAATTLEGLQDPRTDHVVLVEGKPDKAALQQVGIPALGCYGAGLHMPQREHLLRRAPRLVILGFDMDEAGERATERTAELLAQHGVETCQVIWPEKDPGDCSPEQRLEAVTEAVGSTVYGPTWSERVLHLQARFAHR